VRAHSCAPCTHAHAHVHAHTRSCAHTQAHARTHAHVHARPAGKPALHLAAGARAAWPIACGQGCCAAQGPAQAAGPPAGGRGAAGGGCPSGDAQSAPHGAPHIAPYPHDGAPHCAFWSSGGSPMFLSVPCPCAPMCSAHSCDPPWCTRRTVVGAQGPSLHAADSPPGASPWPHTPWWPCRLAWRRTQRTGCNPGSRASTSFALQVLVNMAAHAEGVRALLRCSHSDIGANRSRAAGAGEHGGACGGHVRALLRGSHSDIGAHRAAGAG